MGAITELNLSDEMLDTLLEALDDAMSYNANIMEEGEIEADEFTEAATRRYNAQAEAVQMLAEFKSLRKTKAKS